MKVLSKLRLYGNNVLMYQRRRYFLCIPFLYWWSDWYSPNNALHEKDLAITKHIDKLKKMLDDRDDIEADLKRQVKELSGRYESDPFLIKTNEFWFRKHPLLPPVQGDWRKMLNPRLFKKGTEGVSDTVRGKLGIPEHPNNGGSTAYTLQGFERYNGVIGEDGGFDQVMTFKEPQRQKNNGGGGNGGGKKQDNNPRNRRKGESDEEYQLRMDQLNN